MTDSPLYRLSRQRRRTIATSTPAWLSPELCPLPCPHIQTDINFTNAHLCYPVVRRRVSSRIERLIITPADTYFCDTEITKLDTGKSNGQPAFGIRTGYSTTERRTRMSIVGFSEPTTESRHPTVDVVTVYGSRIMEIWDIDMFSPVCKSSRSDPNKMNHSYSSLPT